MSNNPALYNAAFAGASAGFGSRSLTSAATSFFIQTRDACAAFAGALDTALGVLSDVTQADCDLLQAICSAYWQNRVPTHQDDIDYSQNAEALAAYFLAMRTGLGPSGAMIPIYSGVHVFGVGEIDPAVDLYKNVRVDVPALIGISEQSKVLALTFGEDIGSGLGISAARLNNIAAGTVEVTFTDSSLADGLQDFDDVPVQIWVFAA